jgi:hypothetical protein
VLAGGPSTKPADPAMNEMLNLTTQPSTPPSDVPATQPAVLTNKGRHDDVRQATITLSNGQVVKGSLSTTPDKPIRVWDESIKDYRDVPFKLIKSVVANVVWERDEKEWAFRESGSDVKVYSGKTYPARELTYTFTLLNDEKVTGGVVAPLFYESGDVSKTYVLHKRDKGEVGQKLADLIFVRRVDFQDAK